VARDEQSSANPRPFSDNEGMGNDILGIFGKHPVAGQVKTRLGAETSPAFAATIADAFARDTVRKCAMLADQRFLVYAPASGHGYFSGLGGTAYTYENQAEGDLGQRLAQFLQRHLTDHSRVVLLGADSPTLPAGIILQAFLELGSADVVLGPATDGGYYLIGCTGSCPPLFDKIAWGETEVLGETVAKVRGAGLRLGLLPPWYDIDTLADLRMLRGHLAALRQAGIETGATCTEIVLDQWEKNNSWV
jgi:rSAM/selenodomain-associated transferase 1